MPPPPGIRRASSVALAVLGCLLAVVSVVAVWGRQQVLDTDHYLTSVTPLASDPVIQDEVASKVAHAINVRLDAETLAHGKLPDRAPFLAGRVGAAVERTVQDAARRVTRSDAFPALWTRINRRAHRELVSVLTGDGTSRLVVRDGRLQLDLSTVVEAVRGRLDAAGLGVVRAIPPITLVVDVADAGTLERVRGAVDLLDGLAAVLPVVSLVLLAGSVVTARRRRRSLALVAGGLAVSMAILFALLLAGASVVAGRVPTEVAGDDAVRAFYTQVTSLLRREALVVGLVAAAACAATTLRGPATATYRGLRTD